MKQKMKNNFNTITTEKEYHTHLTPADEYNNTNSGGLNNWKETTLGEIGKVVTGKTPSKDNPNDWGIIMDFITPSDIKNDFKYFENSIRKLSNEGINRFKKMIIPNNSVIVTCIGSDMGKVIINKNDCLTNQQINSIILTDKNDTNFIFYKLKDSYQLLKSRADGGSTMPILNKSNFESLKFLLPPLEEQKAIAAVLSAFDDKIELLREQNKTLEEMGQTIFQEWFGKYSPDRPEELPEGWRVGKLGEVIEFINGYAFKSEDLLSIDTGDCLKIFKMGNIKKGGGFEESKTKSYIKS